MGATTSPMLDAALEYAAHEVPVFPVWGVAGGHCRCGQTACENPGKHPLGALTRNGFKDATTDSETIKTWWKRYPDANIATPTHWCVVLDVDPRNGGDHTLAELEQQYGALPETAEVLTGGGGRHLYFARATTPISSRGGALGRGLDVKSEGGYVLLPPSAHVSGRVYADEVMHPLFDTPMAPLPDWMLRSMLVTAASNGDGHQQDGPDWGALLAGAPEGQRHVTAARIAGHYLGKRLDPGEVERILLLYASGCEPPFDPEAARRIVRDLAAKDAARVPGPVPSPHTQPVKGTQPNWTLYDGADTWGFPPPQPLIEGLLVLDGVTWIGGRPKSYKSLLALYLCLGIAARRSEVAGRFKVRAAPRILYVGREDGGARFEIRRDEVLACWNVRLEPRAMLFAIRPHLDLLNPEHVAWLRDTCLREGITLLVLDTWTALSPGADPMGAKDQAQLAAVVVQLAQDIAGHVVVIDHSRKNRADGQALSSADIFGPLQKWAAADNTVMLERVGSSSRIEVYVEGKDIESLQFFLEVSPRGSGREKFTHAGTVAELADAQRAVGDKNRQAVLLAVSSSATPLSRDETWKRLQANAIKLAPDTVKNHLGKLVKDGTLQSTGKGPATRYAVTGAPPSSPIQKLIQEPLYDPAT